MEAYLSAFDYCEKTGTKKDTALHRAIRGTVPAFQDQNGRWFLYYNDDEEQKIPEGYITIEEYAKRNNIRVGICKSVLKDGLFNKEDIKIVYGKGYHGRQYSNVIIRENAIAPDILPRIYANEKMLHIIYLDCPNGYITVREYCKQMGIDSYHKSRVYQQIYAGKIPAIKYKGHYYINADYAKKIKEED